MRLIKAAFSHASFLLTYVIAAFFGLLIFVMAGYAILGKLLPVDSPIWEDARCVMGFPAQNGKRCWQQRLKSNQREHHRLMEKNRFKTAILEGLLKSTKAAKDKLTARFKELEGLENQFDNINLFSHKPFKGSNVTTGVKYKKLSTGQKWTTSWCYWEPTSEIDAQYHIQIGNAAPTGGVKWENPSEETLKKAGVTRADIEAAKGLCNWPKGVS